MSLAIHKAEFFKQDFVNQFGWYVDEAGPDVARRFQVALDNSLQKISRQPDLGRRRRLMHGTRDLPRRLVEPPE